MNRFELLDQAAAAIPSRDALYEPVNYLIAHAADNAPDDAGRMDSLISLLSFNQPPETLAWFAARGVTP